LIVLPSEQYDTVRVSLQRPVCLRLSLISTTEERLHKYMLDIDHIDHISST
jgi:hypothetical protein